MLEEAEQRERQGAAKRKPAEGDDEASDESPKEQKKRKGDPRKEEASLPAETQSTGVKLCYEFNRRKGEQNTKGDNESPEGQFKAGETLYAVCKQSEHNLQATVQEVGSYCPKCSTPWLKLIKL